MALIATPRVELELNGRGNGWTDVTADVLAPLSLGYGIRGSGPSDRVASAGSCTLVLNNGESNSAGRLGYYSPGGPVQRAGWQLGVRVRVSFQDPATSSWWVRFVGSVVAITPEAGTRRGRRVTVQAADWMDEAARARVAGLSTQINARSDAIVSLLVGNVTRQPEATAIATGRDTYAYALDTARDDTSNPVLQELARVVGSELGYLYQKGDGTVVFEARFGRLSTASALTLDDRMHGLSMTTTRDQVVSRVQVTTHPRTVDAAAVVLYQLKSVTQIPVGGSTTILAGYTDPTNRASRVGGTSMVTPVASTDYLANSAADGSGTDQTAALGVVTSFGGNGVRFDLTNTAAVPIYVTKLQARGLGVYDYQTAVAEAVDDVAALDYGDAVAAIDMPYQSDPAVGAQAADYLLRLYAGTTVGTWLLGTAGVSELETATRLSYTVQSTIGSVTVQPQTAALLTQILTRDVGDVVTVRETVTGLDRSFYVQAVDLAVQAPGLVTATWTLAPADAGLYWKLDTTNYSELDLGTRLAY